MPDDLMTPNDRPAPRMFAGRSGTRLYSINALLERIEVQFREEYGDDTPALREADTHAKRVKLILEIASFVIAVDSIALDADEKADLIRRAHSNLFGYGALDPYLNDERITTISLLGANHVSIRYAHGELETVPALFEDREEVRRVLARLLMHAGATLSEAVPIVEIGLRIDGRPVGISVAAPPATPSISADIRLHPRAAPTLETLMAEGWMNSETADLLRALIRSKYGIVIAGETESGKTMLLSALAAMLPDPAATMAVERAAEMHLPDGVKRKMTRYPYETDLGATFGEQIGAALAMSPACLLLDEVRADEPYTIAPLLEAEPSPRQIWNVRGAPDSKRLQSALGMLARRAGSGRGEALVHALYERLPFVITVARIRQRLQIFSVAEWQSRVDTEYPDYVMLHKYQDGEARPTGSVPARWL